MNSKSKLKWYICANKIDVVKNFAVIKSVAIKSFRCNLYSTASRGLLFFYKNIFMIHKNKQLTKSTLALTKHRKPQCCFNATSMYLFMRFLILKNGFFVGMAKNMEFMISGISI